MRHQVARSRLRGAEEDAEESVEAPGPGAFERRLTGRRVFEHLDAGFEARARLGAQQPGRFQSVSGPREHEKLAVGGSGL